MWQEQAHRGPLTFDKQYCFLGLSILIGKGSGKAQPISRTPKTQARPESHLEPSWDYPSWQGEICVCPEPSLDRA